MDPIMKKGTPEGPLFSWVGGKTKGSIVRSGGPDDQEFSSAVFLVLGFGAGNPIAAFVEQFALAYPDRVAGLFLIGTTSECREKVAGWYERIAVAADIHGFDGSWALGAMVYEIAQGSGQYGLVGAGGIVVAGALLVGLLVSGLRRAGWARRLSTYVRLY